MMVITERQKFHLTISKNAPPYLVNHGIMFKEGFTRESDHAVCYNNGSTSMTTVFASKIDTQILFVELNNDKL